MREAFEASAGTYGNPRVALELRRPGGGYQPGLGSGVDPDRDDDEAVLTAAVTVNSCLWKAALVLEFLLGGASGTALGSVLAGYVILRLQHRRERRLAPELEVLKVRRVEQDRALRRLVALAAEVYHCVQHVADEGSSSSYSARAADFCQQIRRLTREHSRLVGEGLVQAATAYTDSATATLGAAQPQSGLEELAQRLEWRRTAAWATSKAPPLA